VFEKVTRIRPDTDPGPIRDVLDRNGAESSERGRSRVQLAILRVCEGRRDRLEKLVRMGKQDHRDVLARAEYPEQLRTGFVGMRQLSYEDAEAMRRRDRQQYLEWLGG
jgi:hypothetical protein